MRGKKVLCLNMGSQRVETFDVCLDRKCSRKGWKLASLCEHGGNINNQQIIEDLYEQT